MSTKSSKARKEKCTACAEDLSTPEQIKCVTCSLRYHYDCINTTSKKYKELKNDYLNSWVCPLCQSKQPKGDNTNTPVRASSSSNVSHDTSSISNVTLRRPQLHTQTNLQESFTLDNVKQLIQEEMEILLGKIETKIATLIDNKTKEMFKEINEIKESVCFVNNQYEEIKKELQGKFAQVKSLKEENEILQSSVKDLNSRLSIMEQHTRMSNLEIQCVPEHKAENLPNLIKQIGKITGNNISDTDIHKCTRIAKMNPESTRPRSIIVKFSSPRIRDTFLAGVIKFNKTNKNNKLNTNHIGMGGDPKPVYVLEHLTSELKKIHASARLTAKQLNYKFVWIKNGRVFLRKTDLSDHIIVRNIEQLKQLT